jgi:hypothetical protein
MTGYRLDDFHKRQAKGELLPHTPYDHYEMVGTAEGHYYARNSDLDTEAIFNNGGMFIADAEWWLTQAEVEAFLGDKADDLSYYVQQAAANIYSSGFDLLSFVGEYRETLRMFKDLVHKFEALTRESKRTRRWLKTSNWKSKGDLFNNLWLEGRYGWRTLQYDLKNFYDAVSAFNESRDRYSERAGAKFRDLQSSFTSFTSEDFDGDDVTSYEVVISLRGSVTADIKPARFRVNPLAAGWELTKLSFVVDWLLGVGTAIDAASFLFFETDYSASSGYKVEVTKTRQFTNIVSNNIGTLGYLAKSKATLLHRAPSSVSFIPQLKLKLDTAKVLDLVALVWQRLL